MAKGIDRRAARTRRLLHEALIGLILRKDYEAITVQDIIDEADIGRSTFYAHCAGKEALLRSGFEELHALLEAEAQSAHEVQGTGAQGAGARGASGAMPRDPAAPFAFSRGMFDHACEYKPVYRALVGSRGAAVAIAEIRRILADRVRKDIPDPVGDEGATGGRPPEDGVPRELLVQFVVGTFMTVLAWCLDRRPGMTPAEADRVFRQLALGGVGARSGSGLPAARRGPGQGGAR